MYKLFENIKVGDEFAIASSGWGLMTYTKLTVQKLTPTQVHFDGHNQRYRLKDGGRVGETYGHFYGEPWEEKHGEYNKKVNRCHRLANIYNSIGGLRAQSFMSMPEDMYAKVNKHADELVELLKDVLK